MESGASWCCCLNNFVRVSSEVHTLSSCTATVPFAVVLTVYASCRCTPGPRGYTVPLPKRANVWDCPHPFCRTTKTNGSPADASVDVVVGDVVVAVAEAVVVKTWERSHTFVQSYCTVTDPVTTGDVLLSNTGTINRLEGPS